MKSAIKQYNKTSKKIRKTNSRGGPELTVVCILSMVVHIMFGQYNGLINIHSSNIFASAKSSSYYVHPNHSQNFSCNPIKSVPKIFIAIRQHAYSFFEIMYRLY